ncbi:AAA family ATPase [Natronobacterium gregoryi]|uniref:AAA family ATPase n=2 Tax=Natronobacterium gregoryi TaxID=44930 RepID=L0ALS8_NATGS|nr:AAA family ATPase [Natronobacterium gregoryi]AFZ74414.1 AAA+ family ATPase [Natronobacterium gregoryi SP2]ELY72126.1 Vesicle-fusing ATPase [Natronobacterium gregoryi SP2]PLK19744.1 AAA family ATPase [Natronobacterium gregoryi SP2]SFJ40486.1 transitional endoplasmic reticulum ATPase [Natronobacterium gregoryi]
MSGSDADSGDGVSLTVQAAEKRDAGRGVARIPELARRQLGVLSGDTVVVDGEERTVAKMWPADPSVSESVVQIDADTRANAGVHVGDTVTVRTTDKSAIRNADRVTLLAPPSLSESELRVAKRKATEKLRNRPVRSGEQIRIEGVSQAPFKVVDTNPGGDVGISTETTVRIVTRGRDDGGSATTPESAGSPETARDGTDTSRPSDTEGELEQGGVTYEDIGGLDEELELVREMIELPLSEPELFQRLGVEPPSGVLLYGPPGTGKTLIARAVANEVDANFETISGPEIMSKYKGESEERLREVFERAEKNAPTIIFFDEIDSIAGQRDDEGDAENRVVGQLLTLMDGLDARGEVIVIGATNRVDTIDPALRRGGRFDREIQIGVPDEKGRKEILEVHTRGMPLSEDVDIDGIARRTHGFVGADLDAVASEAAMAAIRDRPTDTGDREEWNRDPAVDKRHFDEALASVEPSAMREYVAESPETDFSDVGGLENAKATLRESVEWPLTYDRLFEETNTQPPSGVLLYGPPGTGKTLLARALAGETDVNFVRVDGPEIVDRYVGESEKAIREVFERARQSAPSIVFFDEIDAITAARGEGHEVTERVVSQLLTELDGMRENPNLVVLAATNRKDQIDPALLRPGRLDTHVLVGDPDREAREKILEVHTRGKPLGEDINLRELAAELEGYTGADLEALVRDASMKAIREVAAEYDPDEANERADEVVIERRHLEEAREAVDL